jgi:hypothetical protein
MELFFNSHSRFFLRFGDVIAFFRRTTRGEVSAEPGKKPYSGATLESQAISNGLAAPVATSEAPDLAGARMERAATDRAAVAGENPAGARVWVGGADGCADVWYHHCLGEGDGRAAPLRRDRREGLKAVGQAGKARARTAGYGKSAVGTDTARA